MGDGESTGDDQFVVERPGTDFLSVVRAAVRTLHPAADLAARFSAGEIGVAIAEVLAHQREVFREQTIPEAVPLGLSVESLTNFGTRRG
jgi:hypothetical protein